MKIYPFFLVAALVGSVSAFAGGTPVRTYSAGVVKSCSIRSRIIRGEPVSYAVDLVQLKAKGDAYESVAFVYERNMTATGLVFLGAYPYSNDKPTRAGLSIYESKDSAFQLALDTAGGSGLRVVPTTGRDSIDLSEAQYVFNCQ